MLFRSNVHSAAALCFLTNYPQSTSGGLGNPPPAADVVARATPAATLRRSPNPGAAPAEYVRAAAAPPRLPTRYSEPVSRCGQLIRLPGRSVLRTEPTMPSRVSLWTFSDQPDDPLAAPRHVNGLASATRANGNIPSRRRPVGTAPE